MEVDCGRMENNMIKSKYFEMGTIVVTNRINEAMTENYQFKQEVLFALENFSNKDWGELSAEDMQVNEDALQYPEDLYLLGVYQTCRGKIYIITCRKSEKAGDNCTTVCFPDER